MASFKNISQLRTEQVDKRQQQLSDLLKTRKRKLSDLFYLSLYPSYPISRDQIAGNEEILEKFLQKNDLANGDLYDDSTLPLSVAQPIVKKARSESIKDEIIQGADSKESSALRESSAPVLPVTRPRPESSNRAASAERVLPDRSTPVIPERTVAVRNSSTNVSHKSPAVTPTPALLKFRENASKMRSDSSLAVTKVPNKSNPRSFAFPSSNDSELMLIVVPDRLPEPPQSRRPLAELYYTTQTLPLSKLIPASHKTLSTDNYQVALLEGKLSVVHARIEELKRADKWSLRQHAKFKAPFRPKTHWDHMLDEAKWLQMDFREERKLKVALCYELSNAVDDYWRLGKDAVCVKWKRKHAPIVEVPEESTAEEQQTGEESSKKVGLESQSSAPEDFTMEDTNGELVQGAANSETKDDTSVSKLEVFKSSNHDAKDTADPSLIFPNEHKFYSPLSSLVPFKVSDSMQSTFRFDSPVKLNTSVEKLNSLSQELFSMLPQLPTFTPGTPYMNEFDSLTLTSVTKFLSAPDLNRNWQRLVLDTATKDSPTLPVARPDKDSSSKTSTINDSGSASTKRTSLFGHENQRKYVFIKAPQPPNLKYLEFRTPTIWLPQDDSKLLKLVKEFSYNWDVVAMHMLPRPSYGYTSNIERRTPWQCFERWHQLTPNVSVSDLKGAYSQQAQIWLDASIKAQAITKRRISPLGVGQESIQRGNRRLRWASMFDAIRKSMRKRENTSKPNNSVQRKSQMTDGAKLNVPTPSELSKMKFERDKSIAEAYAQQQRTALAMSAASVRPGGNTRLPGANSSTNNSGADVSQPNRPNQINNGNLRQSNPSSGPVNVGNRPDGGASSSSGSSQAQPGTNGASAASIEQMMRLEKHRQLLRQQAAAAAAAAAVSNGASSGPSSPVGLRQSASPNISNVGVANSSSRSGTPTGSDNNNRQAHQALITKVLGLLQQSLGGVGNNQHLVTLASQIINQHPMMTAEQIAKLAHAQIQRYVVQLQQKQQQQVNGQPMRMSSSGNPTGGIAVNMGIPQAQAQALLQKRTGQAPHLSPQQQQQQIMAQVLRVQQQQQQQQQQQHIIQQQNGSRGVSSSPPSSASSLNLPGNA